MTLLIMLLINAVTILSTSVNINDSVTLEQYLCYNVMQSNTDLVISSSVVQYNISIDSFCWIQNTSNVRISSDSRTLPVNVVCHEGQSGFGFFNMTNLTMQGIVFVNCGAEISLPKNVLHFPTSRVCTLGLVKDPFCFSVTVPTSLYLH